MHTSVLCPVVTDLAMAEDDTKHGDGERVLIFLHGVGGTGEDWSEFLHSVVPPKTKLVLPTAPYARVKMFQDRKMNSW